jgi:hypothetical protein
MKLDTMICLGLFVLAMSLGIAQLWFAPLRPDTFIKVELTLGIILATVLVVSFVRREYKEDRRIRRGADLDS